MDEDFMEIGDTGLFPLAGGWFYNRKTNEFIDPEGNIRPEVLDLIEGDPFDTPTID